MVLVTVYNISHVKNENKKGNYAEKYVEADVHINFISLQKLENVISSVFSLIDSESFLFRVINIYLMNKSRSDLGSLEG